MATTFEFFMGITLLNIISHALIAVVNENKIDNDNPVLFKSFYYFIIFNINIIIFLISAFFVEILSVTILYSYLSVTVPLIIIHFILDEDWIFRFDKGINLMIMLFLIVLLHSLWYVLVLT